MKSIKHISVITQLLVMVSMMANGMVFSHAHKGQSGELITHAHPYFSDSDSPVDPGHTHSEQEFQIYDLISLSSYIPYLIVLVFYPLFFQIGKEKFSGRYEPSMDTHAGRVKGRAPPVLFSA